MFQLEIHLSSPALSISILRLGKMRLFPHCGLPKGNFDVTMSKGVNEPNLSELPLFGLGLFKFY